VTVSGCAERALSCAAIFLTVLSAVRDTLVTAVWDIFSQVRNVRCVYFQDTWHMIF
jgi:hypothetical protein